MTAEEMRAEAAELQKRFSHCDLPLSADAILAIGEWCAELCTRLDALLASKDTDDAA